jgi:hypothetical protein
VKEGASVFSIPSYVQKKTVSDAVGSRVVPYLVYQGKRCPFEIQPPT